MKLVVHFGTAKTGSTSLQKTLYANRAALKAQGILYPEGVFTRDAHHILTCLYKPGEEIWSRLREAFDDDEAEMRRQAEGLVESIRKQAERMEGCEAVILSSEMFFYEVTDANQQIFREYLARIADEIIPFAYVRSPSGYYVSGLQQGARSSGRIEEPFALDVRETIETVERVFGTPMIVRPFERDQLHKGDVVRDFLAHALQVTDLGDFRTQFVNESISAEIMDISVTQQQLADAGNTPVSGRERQVLIRRLQEIEARTTGARRPELRPEIVEAIERASVDALWLRDDRGLRFGDLDYGAIDGAPLDRLGPLTRIEDICVVDTALRDRLLYGVIAEGLRGDIPGRPARLYSGLRRRIRKMLGA